MTRPARKRRRPVRKSRLPLERPADPPPVDPRQLPIPFPPPAGELAELLGAVGLAAEVSHG